MKRVFFQYLPPPEPLLLRDIILDVPAPFPQTIQEFGYARIGLVTNKAQRHHVLQQQQQFTLARAHGASTM